MEMTLVKRIMQQAGKAVYFSILALAMASCTNSQEVEEAKEAAEKAKEEAKEAKKEAKEEIEKMKKELGDKIAVLEAAGPLSDAVKIQQDISDLKTALGDVNSGLLNDFNGLKTYVLNGIDNDIKDTIDKKFNTADVYTKQQTVDKINELNTKIINAQGKGKGAFVQTPIQL
jgi:hypothetical protein